MRAAAVRPRRCWPRGDRCPGADAGIRRPLHTLTVLGSTVPANGRCEPVRRRRGRALDRPPRAGDVLIPTSRELEPTAHRHDHRPDEPFRAPDGSRTGRRRLGSCPDGVGRPRRPGCWQRRAIVGSMPTSMALGDGKAGCRSCSTAMPGVSRRSPGPGRARDDGEIGTRHGRDALPGQRPAAPGRRRATVRQHRSAIGYRRAACPADVGARDRTRLWRASDPGDLGRAEVCA